MDIEKLRASWRKGRNKYYRENTEICKQRIRSARLRWIKEGRCTMCGRLLQADERKTCVNCSNFHKGEFAYAAGCKRLAENVRNNSR
jgi:hypothetical protein